MVTGRPGHSLPELLVSIAFLGVVLSGMTGAAWLGLRWTEAALTRQQATRLAADVLDSLSTTPEAVPGSSQDGPFTITWGPGHGGRVVVTVTHSASAEPLTTLTGRPVPSVPVLPDAP